jgi:hypothetical protein
MFIFSVVVVIATHTCDGGNEDGDDDDDDDDDDDYHDGDARDCVGHSACERTRGPRRHTVGRFV